MSYEDQFRNPEFYFGVIDRLIDDYEDGGCVIAASDLLKQRHEVTDFPSLKRLADKAAFLHLLYLERL